MARNEEVRVTTTLEPEIGDRPTEYDYEAAEAWHTLKRAWEIRQDPTMMARIRVFESRKKEKEAREERLAAELL